MCIIYIYESAVRQSKDPHTVGKFVNQGRSKFTHYLMDITLLPAETHMISFQIIFNAIPVPDGNLTDRGLNRSQEMLKTRLREG